MCNTSAKCVIHQCKKCNTVQITHRYTTGFKPNWKYLHVKITPGYVKCEISLPCSMHRKQHDFFGVFRIITGS